MNLEKPLVFFDLETTGTNTQKDRIVEMSVIKISVDGSEEVKTRLINPEMPIPKEASDIHHITDDKVADAPKFAAVAKNLKEYLTGCDLGGYNIVGFDIPLLKKEFERAGIEFSTEGVKIIDAFKIFCEKFPRTLTGAYRYYCGKELGEDAHGAEADTKATLEVFKSQLKQYEEYQDLNIVHELSTKKNEKWIDETGKFQWSGSTPIMGFGKHRGTDLETIASKEPGFLRWIIKNDFPKDAKLIAMNALDGKLPVKE